VLQVFTSPVQSSFIKSHPQGSLAVWDSEGYVLSPLVVASVAIMYSACGPFLVLVLRAAAGWKAFSSLSTVVSFNIVNINAANSDIDFMIENRCYIFYCYMLKKVKKVNFMIYVVDRKAATCI